MGDEEHKMREPLLKKQYYEGCPGCKVEQAKELNKGVSYGNLLAIWMVVLTGTLPISSLFPFLYFMVRDFNIAETEADISSYAGYVGSSYMLGRCLTSVVWGLVADRIGRKPVIIMGLIIVVIFNTLFGLSTSFWMAVITRFLLGSLNGALGPVKAYATELVREEHQALGLSTVSAAWGVGLIIGPALGGYLALPVEKYPNIFPKDSFWDKFPYFLPCFIISGLAFVVAIACIWIPETLHNHNGGNESTDDAEALENGSNYTIHPQILRMDSFRKNKVPSTETRLSVVLLLFLLQLVLFPLEVNSYEYKPPDNLAVNCGSSGNSTLFNRNWVGDVDTKLLLSLTFQSSTKSEAPIFPSSDTTVPLGSARLSYSNFTYSLPVLTSGPKFLRLHFYPTSYATFEEGNALFSVKVGNNNNNLTLLKDFNPSLWVHRDEEARKITKEYCINVETGERVINVTFLPSSTTNDPGAYAFINGIEVVSMPPFLYYTDPKDSPLNFKLVGTTHDYQVLNHKALETLYRVNVGENQVPPADDTGMFRNWDNDFPDYLVKQYPLSVSSGFALQLNFRNGAVPNNTAPAVVYLTARSYGMHVTEDYNVTWDFEVDSQFTYMVRLHFCEFDWHIQREGDRVFQIFIDDNLAEPSADVISWSGGNLVPVHKDYAVPMYSSPSKSEKVHLSIKLQRLPQTMTNYRDVLLNGIEIFKISDDINSNLAGPDPQPINNLSPPQKALLQSKKSKSKTTIAVIVAVSCLILVASIIGIITVFWRRRSESSLKNTKNNTEGSSLPSHLCRYFTIAEIRAATKNFDDAFIVGAGGFGNVYKGYIDGATTATPVAIKRLKQGSQQGFNEFVNEIDMLSELRHIHLVSLIGYCNDGNEMILVYEFMQRGTLREYLYDFGENNSHVPLTWKQRLEILLGAARGLHYLHAGAKHNIIHRDVKSTNILMDEKWVAKVSDFGLSKVGPTGMSTTHVSTIVKGSLGYLDPEYYKRQRLTLKSDVYSFGVVLLEVLCARQPLVRALEKKKANLVDWVRKCNEEGVIDQTVDPFIRDFVTAECLRCYCQMALSCLHDDGDQRPLMSDVVGALEFALQLVAVSEEDSGCKFGGTQEEGTSGRRSRLTPFNVVSSEEGSGVRFTSSDEDYGSQSQSQTSNKVSTTAVSSTEEHVSSKKVVLRNNLWFLLWCSEIGNPRAR